MSDGWVLDTARIHAEPLPPDPKRPVTRKVGSTIRYEEGADPIQYPQRWMNWLDTFVPDEGEQRFLQDAAGAALVGNGDAKCIVHLVGPRHTGKTTYLNLISMAFGTPDRNGFSGDLANGAIVAKNGGANFAQASAKGVRFLTLSEPSTQQTDDSFLKSISGSRDPIRTERKNRDEERWHAECVLHIAANQVVRFNTRDKAIVSRVNIVEFNNVVTADADDQNFEVELFADEGDGILLWVVEGAKRYLETGAIHIPDSVRERGDDNVVHASSVLRWLKARVDEGSLSIDTKVPMDRMLEPVNGYRDYTTWVSEEGLKHYAHKAGWLEEIEAFNQMPSDRRGKKSDGRRRVWGVIDPHALKSSDAAKAAASSNPPPPPPASNTVQPFRNKQLADR